MSAWLGWLGAIDTEIPIADATVDREPGSTSRMWTLTSWVAFEHPHAYIGPIFSVNGRGDFLAGQWTQNDAFEDGHTRLFVSWAGQTAVGVADVIEGRWHLVAVRCTPAARSVRDVHVSVLLDGVVVASVTGPAAGRLAPSGTLRLGRPGPGVRVRGTDAQFFGVIDGVAVWRRPLSEVELAGLVLAGGPGGTEPGVATFVPFDSASFRDASAMPGALGAGRAREVVVRGDVRFVDAMPGPSIARTPVAFPAPGRDLDLPFTVGESWRVTQYTDPYRSHNGGSAFCWDMVHVPPHGPFTNDAPYPLGTTNAPVVAGADETVLRAHVGDGLPHDSFVSTRRSDGLCGGYLHVVLGVTAGTQLRVGDPVGSVAMWTPERDNAHCHFGAGDSDVEATFVTVPVALAHYEEMTGSSARYVRRGVPGPPAIVRRARVLREPTEPHAIVGLTWTAGGLVPSITFTLVSPFVRPTDAVTVTVEVELTAMSADRAGEGLHVVRDATGTLWQDRVVPPGPVAIAWNGATADADLSWMLGPIRLVVSARTAGGIVFEATAGGELTWYEPRITAVHRATSGAITHARVPGRSGPVIGRMLSVLQVLSELDHGKTFTSGTTQPFAIVQAAIDSTGRRRLTTRPDAIAGNNLEHLPTF